MHAAFLPLSNDFQAFRSKRGLAIFANNASVSNTQFVCDVSASSAEAAVTVKKREREAPVIYRTKALVIRRLRAFAAICRDDYNTARSIAASVNIYTQSCRFVYIYMTRRSGADGSQWIPPLEREV